MIYGELCLELFKKHTYFLCFFILLNFEFSKIVKILSEFEDFAPSHDGGYSKSIQKAVVFFDF